MKRKIILVLSACLLIMPVYATYYEITSNIYTPGLTLQTGDSLYMTDGGFGDLNLHENSTATVEETSALVEGSGGIWELNLNNYSHLDFSGGQMKELDIGNNAIATLSGGLIQEIYSYQYTEYWDNDNQVWVETFHITIVYSGDLPTYNEATNVLTGLWGNGDPFSIHLVDSDIYDPVIDNIQFVPEPATLAMLSVGGLLLRRRKQ